MRHGSLFSGIGGFDLAAQWMGWENIFHCEWNEFGQKVLKYYWPNAISYTDITKTDFSIHRGKIDILTGGFPCQPYSAAGKRLGKEDDRHLWPEMLRAIREIQPTYIVAENVRGLTNWNGGLVFNEVQTEMESEGYEVTPFLLPACAVNAPHRRDRIWFVSRLIPNPSSNGWKSSKESKEGLKCERNRVSFYESNPLYGARITTNTKRQRQSRSRRPQRQKRSTENKNWKASWSYSDGRWPTEHPVCSGNDGLSGKLDGITFRKWSEESIKAYGNAIVPQVAYEIFKAIEITQ